MKKTSCGILVFNPFAELLLCHASGTSRWDIPKGGAEPGESEQQTALRETLEETGLRFAPDDLLDLGRFAYLPAKDLHLYAALADRFDASRCVCTTKFRDARGRLRPEMDAFEWTALTRAPERCGRNMSILLGRKLSLPSVLDKLQTCARVAKVAPPSVLED